MYFPGPLEDPVLQNPASSRETESNQTQPGCKNLIAIHMQGREAETILSVTRRINTEPSSAPQSTGCRRCSQHIHRIEKQIFIS